MAQIRKRGTNKYTISIYLGRGEDGKRKYHYETFHGSKTEAKKYAFQLELKLKRAAGPKKSEKFLKDYLKRWANQIKGTVSERTWEEYNRHIQKIIPLVENIRMYNLTSYDLQQALEGLNNSNLAPRTVKNIYSTLKTALKQAVAWGILPDDPTKGLKVPRVPRAERTILTVEQLKKLLEHCKGYKHYLIIRLLALTGMRLGEVLGLYWEDINFEENTVTIKRAADVKHRKIKTEAKTNNAYRTIMLDAETMRLLKQHKETSSTNLVFSTNGRIIKESAVRKTFERSLRKAGLPHMRIHDLRHTAGSILLETGVSLAAVSAFLGHSSPALTADVYTHTVRKSESIKLEKCRQNGRQT